MKVMLLVRATLVIVLAGVSLSAQNLSVELQRITQQATVTGDLRAAIEGYKRIVARAGANREVAAQALVRMAESYQKLGDAESKKIYEQLLRDYADQKDAVAIARTRLRQSELVQRQGDKAFRMVWSVGVGKSGGNIAQDGRRLSYYDGCNGALHDLADGTNRLLTKPGECTDWLAISRDGSQVAYSGRTTQTTYSELRLASLQGTGVPSSRRLYGGDDLDSIGPNDWSPDGKWIAVTVDRKDRTTQLGIVAVSDGSLRILKSTSWKTSYTAFFSPDGRYVAFDVPTSETSDQRDVFVTDAEGSRQIPAVVHSANDRVMGWSPDGQYLLFSSDRRGSTDLWALSFSEGAPRGTPEPMYSNIGNRRSLGVTSAGSLYLQVPYGGTRDIAIAPIDLSAGKLLGPPVSFNQGFIDGTTNPVWSPDGRYLSYYACRDEVDEGCLVIRSVATGQVRRLPRTMTASITGPNWSSDGRSLIVRGADLRGRQGIFQIDAQTGEATAVILSDGLVGRPIWSPDGKKLYFGRRANTNPVGGAVVVERDLASGVERSVGAGLPNTLSPDGQYVVAPSDPNMRTSLLLRPVAGGQPREVLRLTPPEAVVGSQWTRDSSALIVTKDTGSRLELWLVSVVGGPPRKLDIDPSIWLEGSFGADREFSLSPDGRSIAFVMGKITPREVWALENFLPAPKAKR